MGICADSGRGIFRNHRNFEAGTLEPKMKMTHVLDQADKTEFMVEPEETRAKWVTQYVSLTGGLPPEEEEPSMEQLSALSRRVFSLCGFLGVGSVRQEGLRTARFRSYVATLEGFVTKELAGPTNFEMWQASFRVYRTAMVMLNITPLAHLNAYETHIEKMVRFYPGCWHLIVQADDRARSEHLTRLKLRVTAGRSLGLDQPKHYSDDNPWQTLFRRRQVLGRLGLHPGHAVAEQAARPPSTRNTEQAGGGSSSRTISAREGGRSRKKRRGEARQDPGRQVEQGLSLQRVGQGIKGECQVLRVEQWECPARRRLCGSNQARTQVHHLQLPRSPFPELPLEEVRFGPHPQPSHGGIKGASYAFLILVMAQRLHRRVAGGHEGGSANEPGESSKGPRKRKAPPQQWEGDCPGRDSGSEGEKAHHAKVEEELKAHLKHRTFVFVHHFSGAKEGGDHLEGGVGRAALDGDLSKDRPYLDHLKLAKDGCVDLYHAGFPCTTFSQPTLTGDLKL